MKKKILNLTLAPSIMLTLMLTLTLTLTVMFTPMAALGESGAAIMSIKPVYKEIDLDAGWDSAAAININLNDTNADISGAGAYVQGNKLIINQAGVYVLDGTWQGSIYIEAGSNDVIRLVLNGVAISNSNGPAIQAEQADRLVITLNENTKNIVTDGDEYSEVDGDGEPNAAIYSRADLVFNGTGTLEVTANYSNGILTKDDLAILSGTFNINANNIGIRGRDSVSIIGGIFNIVSGGDGLQSNNDADAAKGWIAISGGVFNILSQKDAIQAQTQLSITGGEFYIQSGGGAGNIAQSNQDNNFGQQGRFFNSEQADSNSDSVSQKGLKAQTNIYIENGIFELDCADDAIHCNYNIYIAGGTYIINSGDDGIHADQALEVAGGSINIVSSYEGLEALQILINGGDIRLFAYDDGINTAGGNDSSGNADPFSRSNPFSITENAWLQINGGNIYIIAQGDGVDSNGNIYMAGGLLYIDGPAGGGNGSIDYNGVFELTGGTLIASGNAAMSEYPSSSTQPMIIANYSNTNQSSMIQVFDQSGNILLTHTPTTQFNFLLISTPDLLQGQSYIIKIGDAIEDTVTISGINNYIGNMSEGGGRNRPGR